ncbi:MAG: NADH-quinone oxidoreductase subunit L [Alphaproteobacteria bacterium]|nr:NADH-quinone oxidoreductase subunit L [Alphaproteobacteria bacterium]
MDLIAVFSPLAAFLIAGLFGKQIGDRGAQIVTCAGIIAAAGASMALFSSVILHNHPYTNILAPWVVSGGFEVSWALRIDQLSVVMMCVINIVSACVHVYSVGYMSHDDHKARFMAYLSLFTFAMLMLVSADNLLQLFFGWEGVGLASYLLIGFWNRKHSANAAAMKAFIVNRVGDFGLVLGLMAMFAVFGSVGFDDVFAQAPEKAQAVFMFLGYEIHAITLICLLLFMGAVGKSAQLGLHTWLPDAMEGPTPVSALIHAATMVTAGVFLVARFSPLFEYAPDARMVVTVLGACTAFVAATIGLTQFDIKRVIAYSTMSQLGYMFFALGVSAYGAAMFHLMTHAFFKALLFLGAGSVIHAMSDEQDMRKMGGIWKKIPLTYVLMWVGSLALAGIPPFAGYYSKDIVLEAAFADHTWFGAFAFWAGIAAAFMTAFYSWRLLFMTFHGKPRASEDTMHHVHESPAVMIGPLAVLAVGAIFAGMIFYEPFVAGDETAHGELSRETVHEGVAMEPEVEAPVFEGKSAHNAWNRTGFWEQSLKVLPENDSLAAAHHVPEWVKFAPLGVGIIGIALAWLFYIALPGLPGKIAGAFRPIHTLFFRKWFFDELYERMFVRPALWLGDLFSWGDRRIVDRFGPDGAAGTSARVAAWLSRLQSGYVYHYAFVMMIAVVTIISWFVLRSGI